MEIVRERAPDGFEHIHDIISAAELDAIAERYRATAGFSINELYTRPFLSAPPKL